ncbi:hypothetical protein Agub_g7796, partial [Astrephomene gubernaculifera]
DCRAERVSMNQPWETFRRIQLLREHTLQHIAETVTWNCKQAFQLTQMALTSSSRGASALYCVQLTEKHVTRAAPLRLHASRQAEGSCKHLPVKPSFCLRGWTPQPKTASRLRVPSKNNNVQGTVAVTVDAGQNPAMEMDASEDQQEFSAAPAPPPPTASTAALHDSMQSRYEQAFSMSQLYAAERPAPIPPSEHERRRRVKDVQEVVDAGRRRGLSEEVVRGGLAQLDSLLPGVLSLHRMKPSDWATVASDITAVADKLILLKSLYPAADLFKLVFKRPRLLLLPPQRLRQDAQEVLRLLSGCPSPCAILEATPDFTDPLTLTRCLASLAATFAATAAASSPTHGSSVPGQPAAFSSLPPNPLQLLAAHPELLAGLGSETLMELTAEYGELSTKD